MFQNNARPFRKGDLGSAHKTFPEACSMTATRLYPIFSFFTFFTYGQAIEKTLKAVEESEKQVCFFWKRQSVELVPEMIWLRIVCKSGKSINNFLTKKSRSMTEV
jgi:hypothetical protein